MSDPATQEIHVGCVDLPARLSRQRYYERLAYLETSATLLGVPRPSALQRWRVEGGEHGHVGLVAPQTITHRPGPKGYPRHKEPLTPQDLAQAGGFRATELIQREVTSLVEAVALAGASVVLFRSPPDFAPSMANRDNMRAFFSDLASPERFGTAIRVWEPQGLWEPETAARFAGELGLVLACDPLINDPLGVEPAFYSNLPGDDAYFRVSGMGLGRRRFDDYAMEPLLEAAEAYRRVWIAFAHEGKYPDAIRLRGSLEGASAVEEAPEPAEDE